MKKVILLSVALVAGLVLAGCVGGGEVVTEPIPTDPERTIKVNHGEELVIILESNPTTGYAWEASHDDSIEFLGSWYEPGPEARQDPPVPGAGGFEFFRFKAVKSGERKVTMNYKRPWEEEIAEQKVFKISVTWR